MRIGRRETKRRLTGLTLPTVLGTGGGSAAWTVEPGDRSLARSVLQYLEDRRVLYDLYILEQPPACIKSVQEIRTRMTSFIADSESPELRNPLRAIQAACRQFLTEAAPAIEEHRWGGGAAEQWVFYQGLGELRAHVGTSIAVIIESFDIDVDENLAKILPPPVDDERAQGSSAASEEG
jgi:hypothetical protein